MNKNYFQKGFTLIEMLIVVAIIAILASVFLVGLTGYRSSAYDSRRLSDLQQVQSYLELYYNVNRNYPTGITSWSGTPGPTDLKSVLTGAGIGVTTIPNDPAGLSYYYQSCASGQGYLLATPMTSTSKSLSNSATPGTTCTGMTFPGGSTCGTAISGSSNSLYCVVQQ